MGRRFALLPALAIAGSALPGCAGIIPAVAGDNSTVPAATGEPVVAPAPAPAPAPTPSPPPVVPAPLSVAVGPADPVDGVPSDFARFLRYAQAAARDARAGTELYSALLADETALDGKRRRCAVGEQLVAVIDLDPANGLFAPPVASAKAPGLAAGLRMLREAGMEIAWISDLPTERSGGVRTALEQSGLDPRGQDIISLRRNEGDTKDQRKASLGGFACIVAIVGDERSDFDARFKYLRKPEAGAALEGLIGDGWFLVAPLIGN